jgi:hypothetical protein
LKYMFAKSKANVKSRMLCGANLYHWRKKTVETVKASVLPGTGTQITQRILGMVKLFYVIL